MVGANGGSDLTPDTHVERRQCIGIGGPHEGRWVIVGSATKRLMVAWRSTIERNTPEAVGRVLARAIADPELREALGKRAREVYERTFSIQNFAAKLHAALGLERPARKGLRRFSEDVNDDKKR
jgi:hypothetical protein